MPLNRIVAFLGPYISIGSGAVASWLINHEHFLGLAHFGKDKLAMGISSVAVFVVGTGVTWLGHNKWLEGHMRWFESMAKELKWDKALQPKMTSFNIAGHAGATGVADVEGVEDTGVQDPNAP